MNFHDPFFSLVFCFILSDLSHLLSAISFNFHTQIFMANMCTRSHCHHNWTGRFILIYFFWVSLSFLFFSLLHFFPVVIVSVQVRCGCINLLRALLFFTVGILSYGHPNGVLCCSLINDVKKWRDTLDFTYARIILSEHFRVCHIK